MTAEERIAQLEQENAQRRSELAAAYQQITQLTERLRQVEGRLAKDSHNSSKPPSSEGPARQWRPQRKASGKKTGGQVGHEGRTLMQVATPDEGKSHRPSRCLHCQQSLAGVPGQVKERRQVYDLPALQLLVQEHQVEEVCCPHCQQRSVAQFPAGVQAPVQYGPNVRALAVYLHQ
jgi:transposase